MNMLTERTVGEYFTEGNRVPESRFCQNCLLSIKIRQNSYSSKIPKILVIWPLFWVVRLFTPLSFFSYFTGVRASII